MSEYRELLVFLSLFYIHTKEYNTEVNVAHLAFPMSTEDFWEYDPIAAI